MKTVINGKIYDTETASVVCGKSTENLYMTPVEGEFFKACRVMKTIEPVNREAAMEYYGKRTDTLAPVGFRVIRKVKQL